jgi:hypothetical protein
LPIGSVSFAPCNQLTGNPPRMTAAICALWKIRSACEMITHIRGCITKKLAGLFRIKRAKFKWDVDFLCGTHTFPFGDGAADSMAIHAWAY